MTPRYQLRTLLLLLAILPPLLAGGWWKYSAWKAEQERRARYLRALQWLVCPTSPLPLAERNFDLMTPQPIDPTIRPPVEAPPVSVSQ